MSSMKVLLFLLVGALAVQNYQYGVMIDAGSTKTLGSVFKWPTRRSRAVPEIDVTTTIIPTKVKIPVARILTDGTIFDSIFPPILNGAKSQIPSRYWSTTRLFLRATGGVRALPAADQITVISKLRQYLRESPDNPFAFSNETVQTLSGEEEGIYGWISTNYLYSASLGQPVNSMASLELSGSSIQITFLPTESPIGGLFPIALGAQSYKAYTHSYLNYGQEAMEARYRQLLVDSSGGATVITDPCGWLGVNITGFTSTYPDLYTGSSSLIFVGTGDRAACKARAVTLLAQPTNCPQEPCAIDGIYQPDIPTGMEVVAFSAFSFTGVFFGCGGHSNLTCLRKQIDAYLAKYTSLAFLLQDFGTDSEYYLPRYHLYAAWIEAVMKVGFRLSDTHPIWFTNTMGPANWELTWSLGADAFMEAAQEPAPFTADMWVGGWTNDDFGVDVLYICANGTTRMGFGSWLVGFMDGQLTQDMVTFEGQLCVPSCSCSTQPLTPLPGCAQWHEPGEDHSQGSFELTLAPDGNSFSGFYRTTESDLPVVWKATRVSTATPTAQQCWMPAPTTVNSSLVGHFQDAIDPKYQHSYMTSPYGYGYASYTDHAIAGYEEGIALPGNKTAILHYADPSGSGSVIRRALADGTYQEFWFLGFGTSAFNNKTCWANGTCGWTEWVQIDPSPSKSLASAMRPMTAQSGFISAVAALAAGLVALVARHLGLLVLLLSQTTTPSTQDIVMKTITI
ncbi:putative nucleoside phosphatase GDA1/CD39 [Paratrimastix pyriformis]|uniref:Nucleoside phosphatase GDA1/CD39 n=1 Tax=Paratrimastix pyriformis TaxID=342808 RepID=A0ABQ8UFK8_9EUKA|nr:putative nucleoside phosphatase GDA1/CD39 [Paratrimastix pyriformis]